MNSLREKDKHHLESTEEFLYDLYRNKRKLPIDRILDKKSVLDVKIRKIPDLRVAYFRSIGPYTYETTVPVWKQLVQWAKPKGLMNEENIVLGVIWSDPDVTPENKLIYDACITIPESITVDRSVNIQNLPGGEYAVYHCEIEVNSIEEAWMSFFLNWLASSNYQPDTRPSYQIYYKHPEKQIPRRVILDLCYAIKPLIY
jgi:AraC family transcriptional regulator